MLIYYDWNHSPNCLKTKILLNELGIEYEQRDVDGPLLQSPSFRSKFPAGQAPAMEDGDLRISESGAIALYLAEKHGRLVPNAPHRRGLMLRAMFHEAAMVAPVLGGRGLFGELYKPAAERDERRIQKLRDDAQDVARILAETLADREYFADELSIADIQLYAAVSKALQHGVFREPAASLVAWDRRLGERPSVIAARKQYIPYQQASAA